MIGKTILHYKVLEKLGEGGMGVVYKAQDTTLDRLVALKFLPPHVSSSGVDKARFVQEAKAASALNHPNILTIYDFIEDQEQSFIAMELVEGESLKTKVVEAKEKESQLPISQVLDYAYQIAQGLSKAHEKGIVHRDVKSDNIMVTNDGLIKIMDFGLAKLKGKAGMTRAGSTVGTAAYMSPEQIQGDEVNEQADIWSFGVVLFELLTGEHPFHGEHESAMMYSITNEDPKPLTNLRADLPSQLRQIIEQCLQKDRSQRYSAMSQILEEMSKLNPSPVGEISSLSFKAMMSNLKRPVVFVPMVLVLLGLTYLAYSYIAQMGQIDWARQRVVPEIQRLADDLKWSEAFALARKAEKVIPSDSVLANLWPQFSRIVSVNSDPSAAKVYWKSYSAEDDGWEYLGTTPLEKIRLPFWLSRIRLEKNEYRTFDGGFFYYYSRATVPVYKLDKLGSIPNEMVHVPGGTYELNIPGLDHLDAAQVADYLIDKFEVTNKDYKKFIDGDGYQKREFWKIPFFKEGKEVPREEAIKEFVDATGRAGPATWELGSYPPGKENYPVNGISWYEAGAYAEFAGKSLPTVFHWNIAAETRASATIIPLSNFDNKGPAPVGTYRGIGPFGTYDMAGNVREWCLNESRNQRYILGGGWNDQTYMFNDAYTQDSFNRFETNGFRCMKFLDPEKNLANLSRPIDLPFRDFLREKPVSDQTFKFYLSLFRYDRTNLHATIETSDTTEAWIKQRITFDAAYGNERMMAYLFLPRRAPPPYQTVIFFPGGNALHTRSSKEIGDPRSDFIISSGRALIWPIYKGTYERGTKLTSDYPNETNLYKEHLIMWAKDLSRSIDYLETRKDIDSKKIAYYGVSWGAMNGPIMTSVEPRMKVVILNVAGLAFQKAQSEVDAINYVSRVKAPVLMLNGRYDHFFPVESSQIPLFRLLGTSPEHKRQIIYAAGHIVPRNQLIKESLDWLDKYLGPVK